MSDHNDEKLKQAFPKYLAEEKGMTLRDYFAAKAMQALIAKLPFTPNPENMNLPNAAAVGAYDYADAMLKERAK